MIRVLLADDQATVRGALAALLQLEKDIEVVAEVGRSDEVLKAALKLKPDVALLDIEMPGGDGLSAANHLREKLPSCRVLMLTTFGRPVTFGGRWKGERLAFSQRTLRRPISLLRSAEPWQESALSILSLRLTRWAQETTRSPIGNGMCYLRLRAALALRRSRTGSFLSPGTVRNYLSLAIQKLDAGNRFEAARIAREKGWI